MALLVGILAAEPDANDDRDLEYKLFLLPAMLTWLGSTSANLILACNVYPLPNLHKFMVIMLKLAC